MQHTADRWIGPLVHFEEKWAPRLVGMCGTLSLLAVAMLGYLVLRAR